MANITSVVVDSPKPGMKPSVLAIGIVFIVLAVCVVFGNTLVMTSIYKFRRLQTLTNRVIFSLALADCIAGLFIFWQSFFSWFPQLESSGPACLLRFLNGQPSLCSAMHLITIAMDRYLAVLHPLRYNEFMTPRLVHILLAVAWTASIILMATIIGTSNYVSGVTICTLPDVVPHPVLIATLHVVFTSLIAGMFIIYAMIFWVARKQIRQIHAMGGLSTGQADEGNRIKRELKAAKKLSIIVLAFFVGHLSFLVSLGLGYNYREIMSVRQYVTFYKLSLIIAFVNSALNPIVYSLKMKEFREAFKRILCACTVSGQSEDTLGSSEQPESHI